MDNSCLRVKNTPAWEQQFPRQIYTTTDSSLICTQTVAEAPPVVVRAGSSRVSENTSSRTRPGNDNAALDPEFKTVKDLSRREVRKHKRVNHELSVGRHDQRSLPSPIPWRLPELYGVASAEFQAILDDGRDPRGEIGARGFSNAASTMARILRVHPSAWNAACETLGPFGAALALLVIDRNRTHPRHPVHNPGGALRAMVARARDGTLRLEASLFAILRRTADPVLRR